MNGTIALFIVLALIFLGYIYFSRRKESKHFELYGPVVMAHTKKGVKTIDNISKISPLFWKVFSTTGVIVGFFLMALFTYTLIQNAMYILKTPSATAGVSLAIPGVTIPLWSGLFGIIVLVVVHEFSHGIIARTEKIKVESVGALLLGFLPIGAFVKPDEKKIRKSGILTQLRVYAAGSFMNIVVSVLTLVFIAIVFLPGFTQEMEGIRILGVEEGSPAEQYGMQEGIIITSMYGEKVDNLFVVGKVLTEKDIQAGDTVTLEDSTGNVYEVVTADKDGRGYIGIQFCGQIPGKELIKLGLLFPFSLRVVNPECYSMAGNFPPGVYWFIFGLLIWIVILNYGVGIANLLPIKPFDGGLMVESVLTRIFKKDKARLIGKIVILISLVTLVALLVNLAGPYIWSIAKFL